MRLSEIGNKEIIDLSTGSRHGQLWDSELLFDPETGEIEAILISDFKASKQMRLEEYRQLPWQSILKIGEDMIIFQSSRY